MVLLTTYSATESCGGINGMIQKAPQEPSFFPKEAYLTPRPIISNRHFNSAGSYKQIEAVLKPDRTVRHTGMYARRYPATTAHFLGSTSDYGNRYTTFNDYPTTDRYGYLRAFSAPGYQHRAFNAYKFS